MTRQLSPAAQVVHDTFRADWKDEELRQDVKCLAAALRAAALYCKRDKLVLLSLAEELESY